MNSKIIKKAYTSAFFRDKNKVTEIIEMKRIKSQYKNVKKQKLSDKKLCFICKKLRHMTRNCSEKTAKIHVLNSINEKSELKKD